MKLTFLYCFLSGKQIYCQFNSTIRNWKLSRSCFFSYNTQESLYSGIQSCWCFYEACLWRQLRSSLREVRHDFTLARRRRQGTWLAKPWQSLSPSTFHFFKRYVFPSSPTAFKELWRRACFSWKTPSSTSVANSGQSPWLCQDKVPSVSPKLRQARGLPLAVI